MSRRASCALALAEVDRSSARRDARRAGWAGAWDGVCRKPRSPTEMRDWSGRRRRLLKARDKLARRGRLTRRTKPNSRASSRLCARSRRRPAWSRSSRNWTAPASPIGSSVGSRKPPPPSRPYVIGRRFAEADAAASIGAVDDEIAANRARGVACTLASAIPRPGLDASPRSKLPRRTLARCGRRTE